jgi:hypothetical protein
MVNTIAVDISPGTTNSFARASFRHMMKCIDEEFKRSFLNRPAFLRIERSRGCVEKSGSGSFCPNPLKSGKQSLILALGLVVIVCLSACTNRIKPKQLTPKPDCVVLAEYVGKDESAKYEQLFLFKSGQQTFSALESKFGQIETVPEALSGRDRNRFRWVEYGGRRLFWKLSHFKLITKPLHKGVPSPKFLSSYSTRGFVVAYLIRM